MERNENGYPNATQQRQCDRCDSSLGDKPLAYAYVPIQQWRLTYAPEEALMRGTLFEELYKPMEVYGNE